MSGVSWAALGVFAAVACDPADSQDRSPPRVSALPSTRPPARPARAVLDEVPSAPPSSPSPPLLDARLVGDWSGSVAVYSKVVDGHQTYTRRVLELSIDAAGRFRLGMRKGQSRGADLIAPVHSWGAAGSLSGSDELGFHVDTSECSASAAGARPRVKVTWLRDCEMQWNTRAGPMPYEVEQVVFRRVGCER